MTDNKLEKYRLTDEEMAEVQGDKEACLAIIHGWGSCSGCSANCRAVAGAQYNKLLPLLEKAKREDFPKCVKNCSVLNKLLSDYPEVKLDLYLATLQQGREGE